MNFLINDKTTKEIIGLFKSHEEAELYYLKNNTVERLKIYRHCILNDCLNNIFKLRQIENLLVEIIDFDETTCENIMNKINYFKTIINNFLTDEDLKLNYSIEHIIDGSYKEVIFLS